jgi:hypothetical protein
MVVPAQAVGTTFYVDPDYTGSPKDGSAAHPWSTLDSTAWSAINSTLTSNDVTIYFSARDAGSDVSDVYGAPGEIDLNNRNSSTHFLTLDGHSMYNTSDASPSWAAYTGANRATVRDFTAQNSSHVKRSNITIDGFRISMTVGGKAVAICGDNWTLKNSDISHTSGATDGPLVLIVPTSDGPHEGSSSYCPASNSITIANNTIHDSEGELVYVGGGGCSTADPTGGSACMGFPAHSNVTIQDNQIYNNNPSKG